MNFLVDAVEQPWLRIYLRVLAVVLGLGALVHISHLFGIGEAPDTETPTLWRVMDVLLLIFDVVVGIGLIMCRPWSIIAYVIGIFLLQLIPYAFFPSSFAQSADELAALNELILVHILMLALLFTLLYFRK